jgi:hypothetical protein
LITLPIPIQDLRPHAMNARQGDVARIAESLRVLGQYRPVVANRGTYTGRPYEILAGHHLVKAAADLGWPTVLVNLVDVDEEGGRRILLADNRTSDLATYDDRSLAELLATLPNLDGTGYEPGDVELIMARVNADIDVFPDYSDTVDDGKNDAGDEIACPQCGHRFVP